MDADVSDLPDQARSHRAAARRVVGALATIGPAAARFGLPVLTLQNLRELDRPVEGELSPTLYAETVASCFDHPHVSARGWEPAAEAQIRVVAAIESVAADLARQSAGATGRAAAVASHGLVLALLLASLSGRAAPSVAEWRSIPMPGLAVLDCESWSLIRPFVPVQP